jgi:hypothetical protein
VGGEKRASANRTRRVDFKIREDDAALMREVATVLGVKMADIAKLWPRCACGFLLVQVAGKVVCLKCRASYKLFVE